MNKKDLISSFTTKNYKAFSLFLFLTLVLWFIIKMTKTYAFKNKILVEIQDVPKYIVLDSVQKSLEISTTANGLKTWQFNLSDKLYAFSFSSLQKDSSQITITSNAIKSLIQKKINLKNSQINIEQEVLVFSFKQKASKYIPVKPDVQISFSPGYNSLDKLKINPDSILIAGSKDKIDQITEIKTSLLDLKNVSNSINTNLKLQSISSDIEMETEVVNISLPVEKFSEKSIKTDIKIINKPENLDISIFPEEAEISFLVAIKDYEKITDIDFKVICDYEERFQYTGVMIPQLVDYPSEVKNPKLKARKVDYVIKKIDE